MEPNLKFYELKIPVIPFPKERPRISRNGTYTPPKTVRYEREISNYCAPLCSEPLEGPLRIQIDFHMHRPEKQKHSYPSRSDWDNLSKAVCDALNKIAWNDDRQICIAVVRKFYAHQEPHIWVKIEQLDWTLKKDVALVE